MYICLHNYIYTWKVSVPVFLQLCECSHSLSSKDIFRQMQSKAICKAIPIKLTNMSPKVKQYDYWWCFSKYFDTLILLFLWLKISSIISCWTYRHSLPISCMWGENSKGKKNVRRQRFLHNALLMRKIWALHPLCEK